MPERSGPESPSVMGIIATCDRLLGEVGRRQHLFGWLRAPGAARDTWLPVDAYYPSRRLVVLCDPQQSYERTYLELIPAHGLRLLVLRSAELPADPLQLRSALGAKITALGAPPPPPRGREAPKSSEPQAEPARREHPVASVVASLVRPRTIERSGPRHVTSSQAAAAQRAARLLASRRRARSELSPLIATPARAQPQRAPRRRPQPARRPRSAGSSAAVLEPPSLLIGLALAVAVCLEIYAAVGLALNSGQLLLAAGVVLDACARALGAVVAGKLDRQDWGWACVLAGSPAVAAFVFFRNAGPVELEPAPLAGLLSVLAVALIVVGALAWMLGI